MVSMTDVNVFPPTESLVRMPQLASRVGFVVVDSRPCI